MRPAGFTLLPVVLAMSLIGAVAYSLNRANGYNANQVGAQSNLARARYAAEAGLQAVNYAIQALGCAGGYPVSALPVSDNDFNGAAYSAYASSSSGSPLTLTSTGTYNGASVTLTKANAYAYQPGLRVWVLQPGPATGKDAYIMKQGGNNDKNYGASEDLSVDINKITSTLLQFDLSPLPPGSRAAVYYDVTNWYRPAATISLYNTNINAREKILLRLITRSWVAGTKDDKKPADGVTFDTYDGVNAWPAPGVGYDPRVLATVPEDYIGWLDIDASTAAVAWLSGVYPNYGVWLDPNATPAAHDYDFYSSNYLANATLRPKLTLYYLLPCGASAPP